MTDSTPASRAAARDYWNSPRVVARCRNVDRAMLAALVTAVMLLGSIHI